MRYRIKVRLAELGMTSSELIKLLESDGFTVTNSKFSEFISGKRTTPRADVICEAADRILTRIETERGIKK